MLLWMRKSIQRFNVLKNTGLCLFCMNSHDRIKGAKIRQIKENDINE